MPIGKMMEVPPALLQFLGSLVAIFALAGFAWWLKLGPAPRLRDHAEARVAADEVVSGFDPVKIGLDRDGRGAIMSDANRRILVLRPHGSHFAGRMLTGASKVEAIGETLRVWSGESRFGSIELSLDDAKAWAEMHERLENEEDA